MRVREVTDLPVAVGFGISNDEQVCEVWRYADAAVVGSAVVAEIERLSRFPDLVSEVGNLCAVVRESTNLAQFHEGYNIIERLELC